MGWTVMRPSQAIVDNLLTKSGVKDPDPADPPKTEPEPKPGQGSLFNTDYCLLYTSPSPRD